MGGEKRIQAKDPDSTGLKKLPTPEVLHDISASARESIAPPPGSHGRTQWPTSLGGGDWELRAETDSSWDMTRHGLVLIYPAALLVKTEEYGHFTEVYFTINRFLLPTFFLPTWSYFRAVIFELLGVSSSMSTARMDLGRKIQHSKHTYPPSTIERSNVVVAHVVVRTGARRAEYLIRPPGGARYPLPRHGIGLRASVSGMRLSCQCVMIYQVFNSRYNKCLVRVCPQHT